MQESTTYTGTTGALNYKVIKTDILIHATPEKVWSVFTDFSAYSSWNPFIRSISTTVVPGEKIKVRLEPPGAMGMTIRPRVLSFRQPKELRWSGHLLFPGLFDGEHVFELEDNGDGSTTFKQNEYFKGLLVPLFRKLLDENTKTGFKKMNEKLKELSEV